MQKVEDAAHAVIAEGGQAAACGADVRNYDQVEAAVLAAVDRFGSLDILVNNAAGNFICPTAEMSPRAWATVIDIDLNGTFHGCRAAYPHLKASEARWFDHQHHHDAWRLRLAWRGTRFGC